MDVPIGLHISDATYNYQALHLRQWLADGSLLEHGGATNDLLATCWYPEYEWHQYGCHCGVGIGCAEWWVGPGKFDEFMERMRSSRG